MNISLAYLAIAVAMLALYSTAFAEVSLPPINNVAFDDRGNWLVNDKPFFPIVLYGAPTDDQSLASLRGHGFNVVRVHPKEIDRAARLPALGFYAAVHLGKTTALEDASGVLLVMGLDSPAMYLKDDLIDDVSKRNAGLKARGAGRPVINAIGYWENEPQGVIEGLLYPKARYADLAAAIEVPAPYLYPVPYQPISTVGDAVAVARKQAGPGKPILPILQLFTWDVEARYPTPKELRAMAYIALIEGATGIGYYSYSYVTGHKGKTFPEIQPTLWQSVKPLNIEIAKVGLTLNQPAAKGVAISGSDIRSKAVRVESGILVVAVNQSSEPRELIVKLPDGYIFADVASHDMKGEKAMLAGFDVFTGIAFGR